MPLHYVDRAFTDSERARTQEYPVGYKQSIGKESNLGPRKARRPARPGGILCDGRTSESPSETVSVIISINSPGDTRTFTWLNVQLHAREMQLSVQLHGQPHGQSDTRCRQKIVTPRAAPGRRFPARQDRLSPILLPIGNYTIDLTSRRALFVGPSRSNALHVELIPRWRRGQARGAIVY
jgi:hypothetical protein